MIPSRTNVGTVAVMASLGLAAFAASPAAAATPAKPVFALTAAGVNQSTVLRGVPGQRLRRAVRVSNLTQRRITIRLQAADIRAGANGNADYVTTGLTETGRWLDLDETSVRLAPGATRRVTVSVRIPATATGASHYAGIVASNAAELATAKAAPKRTKGAGVTITTVSRQALPFTIRLPGALKRSLALRDVKLDVSPTGTGLVLGLVPGGSVLMQNAKIKLRVTRDSRTVLTSNTTLGQLFPDAKLDYRIPWKGQPTKGDYHVTGVIRPEGAKPIFIDDKVTFTPAAQKELKRESPSYVEPASTSLPVWVWLALAMAAALVVLLSVAVLRLKRRSA